MGEVNVDVLKADVEHLKITVEKQGDQLVSIRDATMETKWLINQIREKQATDIESNKASFKENKETNKHILDSIAEIQNAPFLAFKKLSWIWKTAIITVTVGFLGTYVWGTVMGYLRLKAQGGI